MIIHVYMNARGGMCTILRKGHDYKHYHITLDSAIRLSRVLRSPLYANSWRITPDAAGYFAAPKRQRAPRGKR